jgi:hypothetical protein
MTAPEDNARSITVLVVAPFRRDAALIDEMLRQDGLATQICGDPTDLARALAEDGAVLIMSQEALTSRMLDVVAGHLAAQPNWSELPLILLLDLAHQNSSALASLRGRCRAQS